MPKTPLPPNNPAIPPPPSDPPEPSFWATVKDKTMAILKWLSRVLVAPGVALVVVAVAILLIVLGVKNIQVGGILGKLFGKKTPGDRAIDTANSVPEDRVDKDGKIIKPGEADSKGMTQAVVVPIEKPGIFSNPDTVKFTPPGETKPVEIQLPDGVKAKDVDKVVVVKPKQFAVTVKDDSGIEANKIDDLLSRYSS